MFKVLGSIVIIFATSVIGFCYAGIFADRVKQLRELQYSLNVLESEIIYTSTPLIEALKHIGSKGNSPICGMFLTISDVLSQEKFNSVADAFMEAHRLVKGDLLFEKEEMDVIISFMQSLGNSDAEGQKKNFNITIKKLESFELRAEENRKRNEKLFRYLGVCCGMFIVIILI